MKYWRLIFGIIFLALSGYGQKSAFYRDVTVAPVSASDKTKYSTETVFFLPDGVSGFKLFDSLSRERGITELMRQGSRVKAFFNAASGEKLQLRLFAEKARHETAVQESGVLHMVEKYNGSPIASVKAFESAWQAGTFSGGGFEKRVYSGWNPYGSNYNSLHRYTGFIKIEKPGAYYFYTASTDASFLLIDNNVVAAWPGRHGVNEGLYGQHGGSIDLTAGVHRFEYLHANNQWSCYAIAAYRLPGKEKFQVIPETLFTPSLTAESGGLHNRDGKAVADFSWDNEDMLEVDKLQMFRVKFSPASGCKVAGWNYGDGSGEQKNVNVHYYFRTGQYPVTMRTEAENATQTVAVTWRFRQNLIPEREVAKYVAEALEQEKTAGIQPEGYRFLAEAILQFKLKNLATPFYQRMLSKGSQVPGEVVFNFFQGLILDELLEKEKYEAAEVALKRFLTELKNNQALALARLEYARLQFYCLGNATEAGKYFKTVDRERLTPENAKLYALLEADLALMTESYDRAAELYKKMNSAAQSMNKHQQVQSGGVIISIRNCLVLKKYEDALDYIERLEKEQPEMRLNPEMMLIKARVLEKLDRPKLAAGYFERVLCLNPSVATAAAADLALAEFYHSRKQYSDVREHLRRIMNDAPRSREAVAAEKMFNEIAQEGMEK